jgi:rubrerythrin
MVKSDLEVLKAAMATEKKGYNFYKETADRIGPPEAQKMFLSLAQDEIQHLHWLEAQEESLLKKGEWLAYKPPPQKARAVEGLPIFSLTEEKIGNYRSELSALKLGLEMEESSRQLYLKAAAECLDEKGKAMFSHLAAWEGEHWELLKREYDFLMGEYKKSMGFEPF